MTFDIYTYQFQRINAPDSSADLFGGEGCKACSDEAWGNKQSLFGSIFSDEQQGHALDVVNADGEVFIHKTYFVGGGVVVMKVAKKVQVKFDDINFEERLMDSYPANFVIIDNRNGIQRIFIQRSTKSWTGTVPLMRILCHTFDKLMTHSHGMHFVMGDSPVYKYKTFWDAVGNARSGVQKLKFHLPALNLARLASLADVFIEAREETGGAINSEFVAPEGGVLKIAAGGQVEALAKLSAAEGVEIRLLEKGKRRYITILGDKKRSATVEIPDKVLKDLKVKTLFNTLPDDLIMALNSAKTLYE